jgi:hypothetical protein
MVAVRISPDMRMVIVGSPTYFAKRLPPTTPHNLTDHTCIKLGLPTLGGLYAWELKKGKRELNVRVDGQLVRPHAYGYINGDRAWLAWGNE